MSIKVRKLSEEPGIDETEPGFQGVNSVWMVLKRTDLAEFSSRIFRMEPGGHTATHTHEREHVAVVVSGSCRVDVGEESWTAEAGTGVWRLPKTSMCTIRPLWDPSGSLCARNGGRATTSSTGSPRSDSGTPRERCAAAGAKMSRPWNVSLTGCRW